LSIAISGLTTIAQADVQNLVGNHRWQVGQFILNMDNQGNLDIRNQAEPDRSIWHSVSGDAFITAGHANMTSTEKRGSFTINEGIAYQCTTQTIETIHTTNNQLTLSGHLQGGSHCQIPYSIKFSQTGTGHLSFDISSTNPQVNLWKLQYQSNRNEKFYGFGEQYTFINLKGKEVPILTEEQGVGRGHPIIGTAVNLASPGAAGTDLTSYVAIPQYVTNENRSLFLENTEYSVFDLRQADQVNVRVFASQM
jgi:alpha-glucosidase